jgi:ABC-type antimicrobial peptide transport system permease subunit
LDKYNEFFGTEYTAKTIGDFKPHTVKMTQYKHFDTDNPLFTQEVTIVGLFNQGNALGGSMLVGDALFDLFAKNQCYTTGLYFDGNKNISEVIDISEELGFEQNVAVIEGIHTMTQAVDIFIPIFELVAIFLCIGVIFILMSFSSKMIKGKMHEIGIMKAIGAKNKAIGVIFGLQVALIAILTCILATSGYYFFIDLANDVLIESMMRFNPSGVVLDLDFLTFQPKIAVENCILVGILALISLVLPMIKIKAIKPVKIIKAKD